LHNTNLIKILKTFSREEIKEFDKFVRSPYFNSSEPSIKFFAEIKKFHPDFENRAFTKEYLYSKVYGKQKFKEDLFRKLVSNLLILSKQFLTLKNFLNREVENSLLLREQLLNRGLDKLFETENIRITEYIRNRPVYNKYFLDFAENNILLDSYYANKSEDKQHLQSVLDCLRHSTLFYFTQVWNITSYLNTRMGHNFSNTEPIWKLSELILENDEIIENVFRILPEYKEILENYYYENKLSRNPTPENFIKSKEILFKTFPKFETQMQSHFINQLFNTAIFVNHESFNKSEQRLEILEYKLKNSLFNSGENGMDSLTFIAFMNQYLKLKKFESAEEFINKYYKKIDASVRVDTYNYSLSILAYHKKEHGKSLTFSAKVNQNKYPFNFRARAINISNYIELKDIESAYYAIDAFKRFIKNNTSASEEYKTRYNNFLKYSKEIVRYISEKNKESLDKIYCEFKSEKAVSVFNHGYFKRKFEQLIR
jgi:hypothetical protein